MLKVNLNKSFILLLVFSPLLAFFVNFGLIAYGPFLIFGFFITLYTLVNLKYNELLNIFLILPFTVLALISYLFNPYLDNFFNTHLIVLLISIPLIIAMTRINQLDQNNRVDFFVKVIKFFLYYQLIICIGQAMKFGFGIGFDVPEEFRDVKMIPGTFANSNDFSAVLILILYSIIYLEPSINKKEYNLLLFIVFSLIFFSASRLAILISLFIFIFKNIKNIKKILLNISILFLISSFIYILSLLITGGGRAIDKIMTISDIFSGGTAVDNSADIRANSYLFFIDNFRNLGFGSFKINDYFLYSNSTNATYINDLMFQNPHSLIIEVGYWLGYLGLVCIFLYLYAFLRNHNGNKYILLASFVVASTIPSSVLGNFIFFSFFIIVALFNYPHSRASNDEKNPVSICN